MKSRIVVTRCGVTLQPFVAAIGGGSGRIWVKVGGDNTLYWLMARKQARAANTIRQLTWWIFGFTLVVTLATLLNLAIALKWIGQ